MNGTVHDPHAHKRTSINELLNPIASSAIDHDISHQSPPYPDGHYARSTPYVHLPMPPPPHHRAPNGTAFKLNPASWEGADHDRQRVDHVPSPRGFAPGAVHSPGAYREYHAHLSRTHEDGFSEPSVWSSPAGRLGALPAYASPTITQSSYSDERTSIPNDPSATAVSSPHPSRPDSATYSRPDFPSSPYSQRPPQPTGVFGAWPHHVRSPGVPGTHGLTEHPHPQRPHSQSPYLSHPALYSPIPHPSMQYPYMAPHPYPPPSAVLPESRTRKSFGPEETQTSGSKRKRLNAGDAVETNGSAPGYTTNKRNQGAQIAAQNAQLQASTPGSGPNTSDSRASATDSTSQSGNENSSGGADGNGPYHPELQFARCMSNRYKAESFPRCVSCTRRWAGDTCRFQGIRYFLKDENQNIVGVSFVENQKADSPSMKFPTRWNRPLDAVYIKEIKQTVARALLPTLKEEQRTSRSGNENSSGGADGNGPYHSPPPPPPPPLCLPSPLLDHPTSSRASLEQTKPRISKDKLKGLCGTRTKSTVDPTLSSWLKNMDKLSHLIDRLQELASASWLDHKRQLYEQVAALRAAFERQQKHYFEFLRLTEEYASRYLLDISAEIERQSSFLDMLGKRLNMAKTLYSQAADLRKSYESETVDALKSVRQTALKQPLPEESDLFREVDFVLSEISRCYKELDKFWTEEISRAVTALQARRVDPGDVERWRDFKTSLQQTIQSWEINKPGGSIWNILHDNRPGPSGADIGTIASSVSPAMSTLKGWLQRIHESASVANMSLAPILQAEFGLAQNSNLCFTFFRRCVEFGEMVIASSATLVDRPAFPRVRASSVLLGHAMVAIGETSGVPAGDNAVYQDIHTLSTHYSPGSRKFGSTYKQVLSLQRKVALGVNSLTKIVSSWTIVADGLPDALPFGCSLQPLRNLADTWEKERSSMRMVLAALTDDPAEELRYRCLSSTPPRSCKARWRIWSILSDLVLPLNHDRRRCGRIF